jgi:DNA-binding NtrC family response regulator
MKVSSTEFSKTLEGVGHKVSTCNAAATCASAIKQNHYDIVLADLGDAPALKSEASSLARPTTVVPIVLKAPKDQMASAKTEYGTVYDASGGSLRLLPVLNKAAKTQTH